MANPTPPDPVRIAQAYRLASRGMSTRAIAEHMGISQSTAAEYVKRAREATGRTMAQVGRVRAGRYSRALLGELSSVWREDHDRLKGGM